MRACSINCSRTAGRSVEVLRFAFLPFVTLDKDLAAAARAEGFDVLP
jgi:hypothetical protein